MRDPSLVQKFVLKTYDQNHKKIRGGKERAPPTMKKYNTISSHNKYVAFIMFCAVYSLYLDSVKANFIQENGQIPQLLLEINPSLVGLY